VAGAYIDTSYAWVTLFLLTVSEKSPMRREQCE